MNRRLLIAVAASAVGVSATYAVTPAPRLVVGILVEGLTQSDLDAYSDLYGHDGLRRFTTGGLSIPTVDYSNTRSTAATSMLMTGAAPSVNGVYGHTRYDRNSRREYSIVHDPSYIGNFTDETCSPSAIKVSTLADELRASTNGAGRAYSISPDCAAAIISAGHAGNSAVWINDKDGRWSTSTYYKEVPEAAVTVNYKTPLSQRLDSMTWTNGKAANADFRYTFPRRERDRYKMFKLSPRANDEVTSLACDYIKQLARSHKTGATDMLTLTFTVSEYPYGSSATSLRAEQTDAYRRLDSQIAKLLRTIESTGSLSDVVIYIAGIPDEGLGRAADAKWNIPTGEFSPRKARALLNTYLMALHGNGEWVTGYSDFGFYLNNKLADEHRLDRTTLHREAAEFLYKMSGVAVAHAFADSPDKSLYDPVDAPDVIINVNPGWSLIETDNHLTNGKTVRYSPAVAPFYLLYPPLKAQTITDVTDAKAIAPTIAKIIRIRAPNAANTSPVNLF